MSLAEIIEPDAPVWRFKPYPAYKDSGFEWLGEIPSHWQVTRLKALANLRAGTAITSDKIEPDGDFPVFGGNGLRGYTLSYTHDGAFPLVGRQGALCGCVTFASGKFWASEHAIVAAPREAVDPHWLTDLLQAMSLNAYSQSAAQPGLAVETIAVIPVPAPAIEEQRAIAAFLDRETARIDALVVKKEKLIELLQEQRTALITRAVTKGLDPTAPMKDSGIEWLGEIPGHWEVKRIRDIANALQTGPFGSQLHAEEYVIGGYPVINPANLRDGELVEDPDCTVDEATAYRLQHHRVQEGDILFARRGELGRCGLVGQQQEGWLCGTGCLRVRTRADITQPPFLMRLLSTSGVADWLDLQSVGATMQNVNTAIIGRIPIAVPPICEQIQIATYLDERTREIDTLAAKVRDAIGRLRELRAALISAAVTGKIDVRGEIA